MKSALKFLNYGAMGVGLCLALIASRILIKAIEENPGAPIIKLIWVFMIFSVLIVFIALIKEIYDMRMKKQEILEVDPSDPKIWGKSYDYTFKWYNAPYGMAIRELGDMNMQKIKSENVKYKLLLIEGKDDEGHIEFEFRFTRMQEFLKYMDDHNTNLKENLQVGVLRGTRTPSYTFYLMKQSGRRTAIFYLDTMVKKDGKTLKAFKTSNDSVYCTFDMRFEELWRDSDKIEIDALLN